MDYSPKQLSLINVTSLVSHQDTPKRRLVN